MGSKTNKIASIIGTLAAVFYPFIIYGLLKSFSVRHSGAILLALLIIIYGRKLAAHRKLWVYIGIQFGGVAILTGTASICNSRLSLMLVPVFISAYLLVNFGITLISPPSMIARYADALGAELSSEEHRYCKTVTIIWVVFFVANGTVTGVLAMEDMFQYWTLYTGLLSYMIIGTLFGGEFLIRRYKFRKFTSHPLDRFLAHVMERNS